MAAGGYKSAVITSLGRLYVLGGDDQHLEATSGEDEFFDEGEEEGVDEDADLLGDDLGEGM